MKLPLPDRFTRWLIVGAALTILGGALILALRPYVRAWVIEQIVTRQNRTAEEYLAKGDAQNALLLARRSQQRDQDNVEAWQIAARAARQLDRPEALFYQETLTRIAPSREHHLGLIRLADHFGQDAVGLAAVKRAAAVCGDEPDYHRMAAKLHLRLEQPLAAKYFLLSLLQLRPDDAEAQLELARIETEDDPAGKHPASRASLRRLAENPALRTRALGALIRDCLRSKRPEEGRALLAEYVRLPGLTLSDRLTGLEAAQAFSPGSAEGVLRGIQADAAGRAGDAAQVIDFLTRGQQAAAAVAWARSLTAEVRADESTRRALAEALLSLMEWEQLRSVALEGEWPEKEYLRLALLAHAYRALGRATEFSEAWNGAVQFAGYRFRDAVDLLDRVQAWRWANERADMLWKVFAFLPTNPDLRRDLLTWEKSRGNTANINRLLTSILELNPRDREALNNSIYTTLLLDSDLPRMATLAREFHAEKPDDPFGVTMMAIVLLKEKQPAAALRKLESLRRTELVHPVRMALHALLLLQTGQPDKARELLPGIVTKDMLPEERLMVDQVRAGLERLDQEKARAARVDALAGETGDSPGGLRLPSGTPEPPELRAAVRLATRGESASLAELLRGRNWGQLDHVRLALEASAQRRSNPAASRHAWEGAMLLARTEAASLGHLSQLASSWGWGAERIEALVALNALLPNEPARLAELLGHFRERGRTVEMAKVLRPWADRDPGSPQALLHLYLSVLLGGSTSEALVQTKSLLEERPDDPDRQLVHALLLWKDQRAKEAAAVLARRPARSSSVLPESLIRALINADTGAGTEAAEQLARWSGQRALPEEADLARRARTRIESGRP
jgi:hypothetical protein